MAVLFGYHRAFEEHETGLGHPESAFRLDAARHGIELAGLSEALITFSPRRATIEELRRVHSAELIESVERSCHVGGGHLDPDTVVSHDSYEAGLRASGAGLDAIERLDRGEGDGAFLAMRPPGHHALSGRAMGFCFFNHVAVCAAALVDRGERVLIVDWDAHHGNGTEAIFYSNPSVLYVSLHQYPFYPGTGAIGDVGDGAGRGATINVPFPAGTTGDAYRLALDELIVPAAERFSPTWVLVSAGYDAHRDDPLTDLGLTSGDYFDLTDRVCRLAVPGRRILFLEGGYDRAALAQSVGASLSAMSGERYIPEPPTSGGSNGHLGAEADGRAGAIVDAARNLHDANVS